MNEVMVSFVIPVYNCIGYLEKIVKSIVLASDCNYEIILVDDGSTDGSAQLCDDLVSKNSKIICIHQRNCGVSAARNNGLKLASGEYVVFLDSDDSIDVEKLMSLLKLIEQDESIDIAIYGLSFDYYHSGRKYRSDELSPVLSGKKDAVEWLLRIKDLYNCNSLSTIVNKVIKRKVLTNNQLELRNDMFIYEDLEFSLRCMAYCNTIYFCPDVIYHYRQSEDEGNAGRRLKKIKHLSDLVCQIEQSLTMLVRQKQFVEYQKQINNILLSLYLVLTREKISVSNRAEIRIVCEDFTEWFNERKIQPSIEQKQAVDLLLDKQIYRLFMHRYYIAIRHKIAVEVKNTRLYQKLKG